MLRADDADVGVHLSRRLLMITAMPAHSCYDIARVSGFRVEDLGVWGLYQEHGCENNLNS